MRASCCCLCLNLKEGRWWIQSCTHAWWVRLACGGDACRNVLSCPRTDVRGWWIHHPSVRPTTCNACMRQLFFFTWIHCMHRLTDRRDGWCMARPPVAHQPPAGGRSTTHLQLFASSIDPSAPVFSLYSYNSNSIQLDSKKFKAVDTPDRVYFGLR